MKDELALPATVGLLVFIICSMSASCIAYWLFDNQDYYMRSSSTEGISGSTCRDDVTYQSTHVT